MNHKEDLENAEAYFDSVLAVHMGSAFGKLSPLLQEAHNGKVKLEGSARVEQGNFAARLLCRLFKFPHAANDVHLVVHCEHDAHSMRWQRYFNEQAMYSHFKRKREFLIEHLGPLALYLHAVEKNGELHYQFMHTRFFGLPWPAFFGPRIEAWEKEVNGRYHFSVRVNMFPFGLVIAYSGELIVEKQA